MLVQRSVQSGSQHFQQLGVVRNKGTIEVSSVQLQTIPVRPGPNPTAEKSFESLRTIEGKGELNTLSRQRLTGPAAPKLD